MHKELFENDPVLKHSFEFALAVVDYCEVLHLEKHFVISNQLLKSGTAIGVNILEAQSAESKAGVIQKMKIAAKEAGETQYWLLLCAGVRNNAACTYLSNKLDKINKIISKLLSTAKRKTPFSYFPGIISF